MQKEETNPAFIRNTETCAILSKKDKPLDSFGIINNLGCQESINS